MNYHIYIELINLKHLFYISLHSLPPITLTWGLIMVIVADLFGGSVLPFLILTNTFFETKSSRFFDVQTCQSATFICTYNKNLELSRLEFRILGY
jgi:hypothetical protein